MGSSNGGIHILGDNRRTERCAPHPHLVHFGQQSPRSEQIHANFAHRHIDGAIDNTFLHSIDIQRHGGSVVHHRKMLPRAHGHGVVVLPVGYPTLRDTHFPAIDILLEANPGGAVGARHQVRIRLYAAALHPALERPGRSEVNATGNFHVIVVSVEGKTRLGGKRCSYQQKRED